MSTYEVKVSMTLTVTAESEEEAWDKGYVAVDTVKNHSDEDVTDVKGDVRGLVAYV